MHLGNIEFEDEQSETGASRVSAGPVKIVANLLGVEADRLSQSLICKAIEVRGEVTFSPVAAAEAKVNTDALARTLHAETFRWLVVRINESLAGQQNDGETRHQHETRFIGVLDIFGFEIFDQNSFEQLCINFANEKLQKHFNTNTFMEEQGLYKAEGIPFESLDYVDNVEVLALLEGEAGGPRAVGLLPLLDDMCRVPGGTERRFLEKCMSDFTSFKSWMPPKRSDEDRFTIQHYAGTVMYNVGGFMDKNRDQTMFAHVRLLQSSTSELCCSLVPKPVKGASKVPTAAANLRRQLGEQGLMGSIKTCNAKYIRCIKPNLAKLPSKFDPVYSEEQLRYGGVFETVNIRKKGLPFRVPVANFVHCYSNICVAHPLMPMNKTKSPWAALQGKEAARAILKFAGGHEGETSSSDPLAAAVGKTLVFYRAELNLTLELLRNLAMEGYTLMVSRRMRLYLGRRFRKVARATKSAIDKALESRSDLDLAQTAVQRSTHSIFQLFDYTPHRLAEVTSLRDALQALADVTMQIGDVTKRFEQDVKSNSRTMLHLLARLAKLTGEGVAQSSEQIKVEGTAKAKVKEHGAVVLEEQIAKVLKLPVRKVLESIASSAATIEYQGEALAEVQRLLDLSELEFTQVQEQKFKADGNFGKEAVALRTKVVQLKAETCPDHYILSEWPLGLRNSRSWFATKNMPSMFTGFRSIKMKEEDKLASMLKYQDWPIHASILEKTLSYSWGETPSLDGIKTYRDTDARSQFRTIMGYMGDRRHPYPDTLAVELVNNAVGSMALASEVFAQLLKQLTDNPNVASVERGWQLMALLLERCCPSSEAECQLLTGFIWINAPKPVRMKLLDKLFDKSTRPRRSGTHMELSSVPDLINAFWAAGGRPSLRLPRGSRLFSGMCLEDISPFGSEAHVD